MLIEQEIERLVIPNSGQRFDGRDLRALRQPGVYVIMGKEEWLYVGMSNKLLQRIGSKHAQAGKAFEECEYVLLYPCVSISGNIAV